MASPDTTQEANTKNIRKRMLLWVLENLNLNEKMIIQIYVIGI